MIEFVNNAEGHDTAAKIFNFGSHTDIPTILHTFEMLSPQTFLKLNTIKNTLDWLVVLYGHNKLWRLKGVLVI